MVAAHEQAVRDIGEFGLIERIQSLVHEGNAVLGIGDDCAVLDQPGANYFLITTDMLVEDVHFRRDQITPFDLGRRALAVNISDIAAMGGVPRFGLTSLALPPGTEVAYLEDLYRGLLRQADASGIAVVGGNITKTRTGFLIDVALVGEVPKDQLVRRSGAVPGDLLVVTGDLGDATIARLARDSDSPMDEITEAFSQKHLVPDSRVKTGRTLASSGLAHAMIDISDGLASDVRHLAHQSNVGATILERDLPLSEDGRRIADKLGVDIVDAALTGGEDYELLVAVAESDAEDLRRILGEGVARVVGHVNADKEIVIERRNGTREALEPSGWVHF